MGTHDRWYVTQAGPRGIGRLMMPSPSHKSKDQAPIDDDVDADVDADLLEASVSDPEAFGLAYDHHIRSVLAFFYRRTADAWLAADLAAETFAEAFASRGNYRRTDGPAGAWIFGIAHNQLRRAARRGRASTRARRRLGIEPADLDDFSLERIEELVDFEPVKRKLELALGKLSPKIVEALRLRVELGMSYEELARRLHCSEGAARVRVSRGLSQLERLLEVGE